MIDRLEIDTTLGEAPWIAEVAKVLSALTEGASPGRLKGTAEKVVLAGIVPSEEIRQEIEAQVRQQIPDLEIQSYLRREEASGDP